MEISRKRTAVSGNGSGIFMEELVSEKLKTNSFIIRFMTELREDSVSAFAAVPFILEDTCRSLPTITAFNRRLGELYGASVRGGLNRFADCSVISFSSTSIADKYALSGEKITYETLRLLLDCITDPVTETNSRGEVTFPEKQFELKRQELIDEIEADINDKRSYALKRAAQVIFKGEPAGISVKGEREGAERLTREDVYAAYREMLSRSRIEVTFVGCSLPEECRVLLSERLSAFNRKNVFLPRIVPSPIKNEPEYITEQLSVAQCKMVMGFKYPEKTPKAVLSLFVTIFGASPFSLLFKNVREKLSLCYYCSASQNRHKHTIFVDSGVETENIDPAREEILRQMDIMKRGEYSDEIVEQSKLLLVSSSKGINEDPRAVSDWYFAQCIEETAETPEDYARDIMAVTREQLMGFAAEVRLDTVYTLTGNSPERSGSDE